MNKDSNTNSDADETEEINDDDATLADDLLDEVSGDVTELEDDAVEGFGILPVEEESDEEDDEEGDNKKSDADVDHDLEDDAEDVDFDTFDDIDEL